MITWIHEFLGNYSVYCYGAVSQDIMDTIFIPVVVLAHSFIFPLENLYVTAKFWAYNAHS